MSQGVYMWSQTAGTNASVDSSINMAEGMPPSAVNDGIRALMAAVAKYRDDTGGANNATGGTSTAYTLTSNQVFDSAAHMAAQELTIFPHVTSGASPTLNVDGLGAFPIVTDAAATAVPTGTLIAGSPYILAFVNSSSHWRLKNFFVKPYEMPIGAGMDYWGATVPNNNFAFPIGQAISRTTYAALFALIGTTYGVGDGTTTFNLPDKTGRVTAMKEAVATRLTTAGGGVDGGTLGAVGGAQNGTILQTNLPAATLLTTIVDPGHAHSYNQPASFGSSGAGAGILGTSSGSTTGASATGITASTALGGSGTAFKIAQPTIVCNYIMRII